MVRLTALQIYAEDNGHNMNMTVLNQQNNESPHTMIALNSLKNNLDIKVYSETNNDISKSTLHVILNK